MPPLCLTTIDCATTSTRDRKSYPPLRGEAILVPSCRETTTTTTTFSMMLPYTTTSSSSSSSPPRPRGLSTESATSLPPYLLPPPPPPPEHSPPSPWRWQQRFISTDADSNHGDPSSTSSSSSSDKIENNDPQGKYNSSSSNNSNNRRRCVSLNSALELEKCGRGGRGDDLLEWQLTQSLERYSEDHPTTSKLYNKVGNVYFRRGHFARAATLYEQAARCASSEQQQHVAWLNLGTVYWRTQQVDTAIDYLQRAAQPQHRCRGGGGGALSSEPNDAAATAAIQASVYHQLGLCYALLPDYQLSIQALNMAYDIRAQYYGDHHWSIAKTLDAIGRVHLLQGEYEATIHCHGRALAIAAAYQQQQQQQPRHSRLPTPASAAGPAAIMEALRNLATVFRAAGRSQDLLETLVEQLRLVTSLSSSSSSSSSDPQMMIMVETKLRAEIAQLQQELAK
jgi:tetratricopeptide (TPR) repeat protein